MEARIVRDQLQSCYRAEGVNHYEACRELSEKYLALLKENRVGLQLLPWKLHVIDQCASGERLQTGRCVASYKEIPTRFNGFLFPPTNPQMRPNKSRSQYRTV
jgi:hypothetical protein